MTPEDENQQSGLAAAGVKLRLAVVDDPALAAAVSQSRGEWSAQTGSDYTVEQISLKDLHEAKTLEADVLIVPSAEVGLLAAKKLIAAIPANLLDDENPDWSEVFTQLRVRETTWANKPVAVPFGSPVFTCYYRADLLAKLGRKPPKTWAEYQALSQLLADRKNLGKAAPSDDSPWVGAISPLGPGWAGQVLLARAAAYATHREIESTLFQIDTMEPLIAGPPFVRALKELVANAALGPKEQTEYDPAAVRKAFWEGRCGLAITWPTAADKDLPENAKLDVGFAELPGSTDVYHLPDQTWEKRRDDEDPHVPLLGVSGRMGVVAAKASYPDVAYQLLFRLSKDRWGRQVCCSTAATTLFRTTQTKSPESWVEKPVSAAAALQYSEQTQKTLSRTQRLLSPRIPGRQLYMEALDTAVQKAVRGEKSPEEALAEASTRWRDITQQYGLEAQRTAYWESVGLD